MEIKVGDKVRVREDAPKIFLLGWYGFIGNVVDIEDSYAKIECNDCTLVIPTKYLVKVEDEKIEPRFKRGDRVMHKGVLRSVNSIDTITHRCLLSNLYYYAEWVDESDLEPYTEPTEEKKDNTITIPVKVDLDETFWDAYTADLAREIAIKLTTTENPYKIGAMAVQIAKSVVEGLKKK